MEKLSDRKQIRILTVLLFCTYMVSYLTRINFGTIISEMEKVTKIPRDILSMSITGSFITYGLGQIISGICGDKIAPKKLILVGLCTTVVMNVLIPFCTSPYAMLVVWCINGFAQSFMWPPLVVIMVELFTTEDYSKTSTIVSSYAAAVGTILLYLISPLLISVFSWKAVFWFSAICGALMFWALKKFCPDVMPPQKAAKGDNGENSKWISPTLILIMISITFLGMLRDGATTWMPTYISEVCGVSNLISILSGSILPIFQILCCAFALKFYINFIRNPITCAGIFFGISTIAGIALFFAKNNAVMSVISMAFLTGASHGSNLMLISMVPAFFKNTGKVSTVSGVLNSFVYVGSAISTYGIALLSQNFDWSYTVLTWIGTGILGTVICFATAKRFLKKYNR